jgi:hypothetical protein
VRHLPTGAQAPTERIFDVEIALPNFVVFDGEISFNVAFSVEATFSANSTVTADAIVMRPSFFAKICSVSRMVFGTIRALFSQ